MKMTGRNGHAASAACEFVTRYGAEMIDEYSAFRDKWLDEIAIKIFPTMIKVCEADKDRGGYTYFEYCVKQAYRFAEALLAEKDKR